MGIHTQTWEGFVNYSVETDTGAMMYIPCFIKTRSEIQKLMGEVRWGGFTETQTAWRQNKPPFIFFKIWNVG